MLYQPSNISPDQVNNTGTVDVTQGIDVSWRVNGDSAMTDYKIDFYQNDSASTPAYSTGKVTLSTPFWGVNYAGEVQYFTASISASALSGAGMANGNEYKFLITQWWSADDSVQQYAASVIVTRALPTVTLTAIPSDTVTSNNYTFTATFAQDQGDGMKWGRWKIATATKTTDGGETTYTPNEVFRDTGPLYGIGELRVSYDGFLAGQSYAVQCIVESANGVQVTTGWVGFDASYSLDPAEGDVTACVLAGSPCVRVQWPQMATADGYTIMRQTDGEQRLVKIADVDNTTGQIQDYSAKSGRTYTYYVFPTGIQEFLTDPMVSNEVAVQYWFWSILEAQATDDTGVNFSAMKAYSFRYGEGGVSEGAISNNNNPTISANFTRYPTWQGTTPNYLSGSVSGFIGTISRDSMTYSDTAAQSDALYALSNSQNALFLIDPKGHFLRIRIASAITVATDHKKREMPQTATVSWVEVGTTEGVHVIMYPGGDFYPVDRVILTTLAVNTSDGSLRWTVPDDYAGTGSQLSINGDGAIVQTYDDNPLFTPADMAFDQDTGNLTATVGE